MACEHGKIRDECNKPHTPRRADPRKGLLDNLVPLTDAEVEVEADNNVDLPVNARRPEVGLPKGTRPDVGLLRGDTVRLGRSRNTSWASPVTKQGFSTGR